MQHCLEAWDRFVQLGRLEQAKRFFMQVLAGEKSLEEFTGSD